MISPDCSQESVLGTALSDKSYTIHATTLDYDFDWATSRASCPLTVTMELVLKTDAAAVTTNVGTPITANDLQSNQLLSFDPATMKFSVFYNLNNEFRDGSVLVQLKADNLNTIVRTETFNVNFLPDC